MINDRGHVDTGGIGVRHGRCDEALMIGARRGGPFAPADGARCRHARQHRGPGTDAGVDRQLGLVHPAQVRRIGMDMHQPLARPRRLEQRIAVGRDIAEPRAEGHDQICTAHAFGQPRIDAQAQMADVVRIAIVEHVLTAEGAGHRQIPRMHEARERGRILVAPVGAAGDHQRTLRGGQQPGQRGGIRGRRRGDHGPIRAGVAADGIAIEHILGQRQHHRPGTARGRDLEGARDQFGNARRVVDFGDPFRHAAEHRRVIDFLEGLPAAVLAGDLPDEQDHRRRILRGNMDADAGMRGAGPARDKADAGAAGQLAVGLGHIGGRAFVLADDQVDRGLIVQRVQHVEKALARHAEHALGAVDAQRVDQDAAAAAWRERLRGGGRIGRTRRTDRQGRTEIGGRLGHRRAHRIDIGNGGGCGCGCGCGTGSQGSGIGTGAPASPHCAGERQTGNETGPIIAPKFRTAAAHRRPGQWPRGRTALIMAGRRGPSQCRLQSERQ